MTAFADEANDKKRLIWNSASSLIQIFVASLTLFILYRVLLRTIGVSQVGLWSLILSTVSFAQVTHSGLAGSVVRYVAKYAAGNDPDKAARAVQTAVISVSVLLLPVVAAAYPLCAAWLALVIPQESLAEGLSLLPYALGAFWISAVAEIYKGGLDGCQHVAKRNVIMMADTVSHLCICLALSSRYGLLGLAWARVIQNVVTLILSRMSLAAHMPAVNSFLPLWDRGILKEMFRYALNYQIMGGAMMLYEPVTKSLLSRFESMAMVGYYEMASRLVLQVRTLMVASYQSLVPYLAKLHESQPSRVPAVYGKAGSILFFLAAPAFSGVIVGAPLASRLWIGYFNTPFIYFVIVVTIGWWLNTLAVPAYFAYIAEGKLRWNVTSHVVMALVNAGLGVLLGQAFGGFGVVAAWMLALAVGGAIIVIPYHRENNIGLAAILSGNGWRVITSCLIGTVLSYGLYAARFTIHDRLVAILMVAVLLTVAGPTLWQNPLRTNLTGWFGIMMGKTRAT